MTAANQGNSFEKHYVVSKCQTNVILTLISANCCYTTAQRCDSLMLKCFPLARMCWLLTPLSVLCSGSELPDARGADGPEPGSLPPKRSLWIRPQTELPVQPHVQLQPRDHRRRPRSRPHPADHTGEGAALESPPPRKFCFCVTVFFAVSVCSYDIHCMSVPPLLLLLSFLPINFWGFVMKS